MSLPRAELSAAALWRVFFRRWKTGVLFFAFTSLGAFHFMSTRSQKYAAEIVIETKTPRFTPAPLLNEFELTRLTSETQQTIMVLTSPFMMEAWLKALGDYPASLDKREKARSELRAALTVRPINYTTLFVIRTLGVSPQQAEQRAASLVSVFTALKTDRYREESNRLLKLLNERLTKIERNLLESHKTLRQIQAGGLLDMAGSDQRREAEFRKLSQESLFAGVMIQKEEAERALTPGTEEVVRTLTAPIVSRTLFSRTSRVVALSLLSGFLAGVLMICLFELQDPCLRRAGDVYRYMPLASVIPVPWLNKSETPGEQMFSLFDPLLNDVQSVVKTHGHAMVQIISFSTGDGKTTLSRLLARWSIAQGLSACHVSVNEKSKKGIDVDKEENSVSVTLNPTRPVDTQIQDLLTKNQTVWFETNTTSPSLTWNGIIKDLDILCVILKAGQTPRTWLRAMTPHLSTLRTTKIHFILNLFQDPLPTKLC